MPRHSPCALSSLTKKRSRVSVPIPPGLAAERMGQFVLPISMQLSKNPAVCLSSGSLKSGLAARLRGPSRQPSGWWACLESNQGPRPYQGRALTS